MRKLNLGCGNKKYEGWINIDLREGDVQRDILRGLPFDDNSVDEIMSENFMEHIPQSEVIWVMNEMWRVLKSNGTAHHIIPLAGTYNMYQDPTHLSNWALETFAYFEKDNPKNEYYGDAIKPWKIEKLVILPPKDHTIEVILEK